MKTFVLYGNAYNIDFGALLKQYVGLPYVSNFWFPPSMAAKASGW